MNTNSHVLRDRYEAVFDWKSRLTNWLVMMTGPLWAETRLYSIQTASIPTYIRLSTCPATEIIHNYSDEMLLVVSSFHPLIIRFQTIIVRWNCFICTFVVIFWPVVILIWLHHWHVKCLLSCIWQTLVDHSILADQFEHKFDLGFFARRSVRLLHPARVSILVVR